MENAIAHERFPDKKQHPMSGLDAKTQNIDQESRLKTVAILENEWEKFSYDNWLFCRFTIKTFYLSIAVMIIDHFQD